MPSFFDSAFRNETSISSEKPRSFKLMCVLSFSSILRTTRSPKDDGKVETRKSTSFFPILIDIRPSCGSLLAIVLDKLQHTDLCPHCKNPLVPSAYTESE